MQKFLKLSSLVLAIIMLVNMLPMQTIAAEKTAVQTQTPTVTQTAATPADIDPEEVVAHRTKYTKEFNLGGGLFMAAVYPDAVHYETADGWKEIDNTLKLSTDGSYGNTAGDWQVSFPDQLSAVEGVTVTKDGYTLSFTMAGEIRGSGLSVASATENATLQGMTASKAVPQQVDISAQRKAAQFAQMVPEKLYSRLQYKNVFPNTDIIYDLESNRVKESIVLEAYNANLQGYRYTLNLGSMIPVLEESGQILFYDSARKNIVMVMPAPYLMDSGEGFTEDIQVQLTGKGSTYTLTYLLPQQWLAAEERQWPVILDPVVQGDTAKSNISDVTVSEGYDYSYNWGMLQCGHSTSYGVSRFYVMYDELPALTSSDVVLGAQLALYKHASGNSMQVNAHKVNATWASSTMTWENKPAYNPTIEDYSVVSSKKWYYWNITEVVRDWYAESNTGIMFKVPDDKEASTLHNVKQFRSVDYGSLRPTLAIWFRNNNGLESYWDYTSSSAGRAGTGSVNNYTGNLTWTRNDIGFGGNLMPVSISHVYNLNDSVIPEDSNNSNDSGGNYFGMGNGWRTNFNQRVYQWNVEDGYYVWEDADGTDHYFTREEQNGPIKDEDGLELELKTNGSDDTKYTITDKQGNKSYFDTSGRLRKLENNQATPSSITVDYTTDTGSLIDKVTDGADRVYDFRYHAETGLLDEIAYMGAGTTDITYVRFEYDEDKNLKHIVDKDREEQLKVTYTYEEHRLKTAQDIDGYKLTYAYNTPTADWQPYRVQTITEHDGSEQGGALNIEYSHNQTKFTDHNGNVEIHQFNDYGNTVSIRDGEGRAVYAQYAKNIVNVDGEEEEGKRNQMTLSSKLQYTVVNLLPNSGFEKNADGFSTLDSAVTMTRSSAAAYYGSYSLALNRAAEGTESGLTTGNFTVEAGKNYTFSAYVKTGTGAVTLAINDGTDTVKGETLAANSDWTRIQVNYTNDSQTDKTITARILTSQAGTAYVDGAQLEQAETASRYNLIENGDFHYGLDGWTNTGFAAATGTAAAPSLDASVVTVTGDATAEKRLIQELNISGNGEETFIVSGWAKADAAPLSDEDRAFGIHATIHYTDGTTKETEVSFNTDVDEWQYASMPIVAKNPYNKLTIRLEYDKNVNTAIFDGIQLYKEGFGSSYTYDEDGNVTSVKNVQGQTTSYEYTDNNLTEELLPTGAKLIYAYDEYHNVTRAVTDEGHVYTFDYDAYGNNTAVSIWQKVTPPADADALKALTLTGPKITSTATYTPDGNRLVSTTDASGNVTTYSYNADTNVLEWVQYPENNADTRTEYTYDNMYRMTETTAKLDSTRTLSAEYTYTDDLLTAIETPTATYHFAYGDFALRERVKIGTRTLATYSYTDRDNYLETLDYGNGDRVSYTYDKQGRVTAQTYEDGATVSYKYDNSGALATVKDSATGRTTTYYYDATDRLMKYVESGTDYSHGVTYAYDNINNLTRTVENFNGANRVTGYTYDDDNRLSSITQSATNEHYQYDAYGRVSAQQTKVNSLVTLNTSFVYETLDNGNMTSRVSQYDLLSAGNYLDRTYSYTYDDNGNILSVSDGTNTTSYVYDAQNQLTRENNQAGDFTHTWTYDTAGNILSRSEYAYTTGELGDPTKTVTYGYGDEEWKDLLTAYDGKEITYDQIGNPLSDGTWGYTWQHGRQLASMTKGSTTWNYTYNADGMRTSRTNGSKTYKYYYNGSQLTALDYNGTMCYFTYDAGGSPICMSVNSIKYYYVTNLQGDIIALLNYDGKVLVEYTYDAWGNVLSMTGPNAYNVGQWNPLCYRGYVYDQETKLYYLQSRYYNPEIGRFINGDVFAATGQGLLGNNMFAYCGNNPVANCDSFGYRHERTAGACGGGAAYAVGLGMIAAATMLWKAVSATAKAASKAISTATSAIADVAKKTAEKLTKREHSVYHLKDGDKVEYVGRTKDVEKRKIAHKTNPDREHLEMEVVAPGLTYGEARALEQASMVYYHTINTAHKMHNQINGIAPKYWDAFKEVALGTMDYAENKITNEILCWAEP